jgi:hypothetical protein
MHFYSEVLKHKIIGNRHFDTFASRVVYDLDALLIAQKALRSDFPSFYDGQHLKNNDAKRIGRQLEGEHLHFESRFESGNLRRATQVFFHLNMKIMLFELFSYR